MSVFLSNIVVLIFLSLVLAVSLRFSMKKEFFTGKNIMYWAGIIFCRFSAAEMIIMLIAVLYKGEPLDHSNVIRMMLEFAYHFNHTAFPILSLFCILMLVSNWELMRREGRRFSNGIGSMTIGFVLIANISIHILQDFLAAKDWSSYSPVVRGITGVLNGLLFPYLTGILCYLECVMAGIIIMGWWAVKRRQSNTADYLIILGCKIGSKGQLLPLLKGRADRALEYAHRVLENEDKQICFVPTGGQGQDEVKSEGDAIRDYLLTSGISGKNVMVEDRAANTKENFLYSKQLIGQQNAQANVTFVTTNYHVFRSGLYATEAGFDEIGAIASKTKWYFWPNGFAREMIAILVMTKEIHIFNLIVLGVLCCFNFLASIF